MMARTKHCVEKVIWALDSEEADWDASNFGIMMMKFFLQHGQSPIDQEQGCLSWILKTSFHPQ